MNVDSVDILLSGSLSNSLWIIEYYVVMMFC